MTLANIAESGFFGNTIHEAANALLHDAYAFLNAKAAETDYINKLNTIKQ